MNSERDTASRWMLMIILLTGLIIPGVIAQVGVPIDGNAPGDRVFLEDDAAPGDDADEDDADEFGDDEFGDEEYGEQLLKLKFDGMPLEMLLAEFAKHTRKTLLFDPAVSLATEVTLKSTTKLTLEEYLEAIETVLLMNNVTLQKKGDKFLRVLPTATARKSPMPTNLDPDKIPENADRLVSQMIVLQHIGIAEGQAAIGHLQSQHAVSQPFERLNSVLITDWASNINEILELVKYIDQPAISREKLHIIEVYYSKASDIKSKIDEIIEQAKTEQQRQDEQRVTVPRARPSGPPGVIRAPRATMAAARGASETAEPEEGQGLIRGSVKIVADDKVGILIFITRDENMVFFNQIVKALDIETKPDVMVKVFRLEFANAETIAGMLNDLIGAVSGGEESTGGAAPAGDPGQTRARALEDYIRRRDETAAARSKQTKSKLGELASENIKILPDERTNSLIIMAREADIRMLEEIISEMDMMLSQVLIEVVIIEVGLNKNIHTGVDWLQRMLIGFNQNADGTRTPIAAFGGKGGGAFSKEGDASALLAADSLPGGVAGLTYYLTHFGLNVDMLIKMTASDSQARILSSPTILTTDNTPATATIEEQVYFRTGTTVDQYGTPTVQTELRSVGLALEVTPHINKNKFVMLEIKQTISNISGEQLIDGTSFPTTASRVFTASITVRDRETVILGGLVRQDRRVTEGGIPILKDLPFIGRAFGTHNKTGEDREVLVLITPYVSETPAEAEYEAARRTLSVDHRGIFERGWSDSRLAKPNAAADKLHEQAAELLKEERPMPVMRRDDPVVESDTLDEQTEGAVAVKRASDPDNEMLDRIMVAIEELKASQIRTEQATLQAQQAAARAEQAVQDKILELRALENAMQNPGQPSQPEPKRDRGADEENDPYPSLDEIDPAMRRFIDKTERSARRGINQIDREIEQTEKGQSD